MKTRLTEIKDGAARGRRPAQRRGSVIVLAIGALAALAIVAIAYTVAVRTDRASATTHAASLDGRRQAEAVAGDIASLLAADLNGGKIVTPDMPRFIDGNFNPVAGTSAGAIRLWPRAFEDGDYIDAPRVEKRPDRHTFGLAYANEIPGANSGNAGWRLDVRNATAGVTEPSVAPVQDDPWLASSEPAPSSLATPTGAWDTWAQITNMRSAYRWRKEAAGNDYYWMRDDGRYADLARFFLSPRANDLGRGDPDADLMSQRDATNDPSDWFDEYAPLNPNSANDTINGPALGVNQRVFDFQMNAMGAARDPRPAGTTYELYSPDASGRPLPPTAMTSPRPIELDGLDYRYWTDTDGDLRPDARWQEIDALGSVGGLRWVAAVRIVDLSALVNVNTAVDGGLLANGAFAGMAAVQFPNQPAQTPPVGPQDTAAAGATPADVDLFRLLYGAHWDAGGNVGAWNGTTQTGVAPLGGGISHYSPAAQTSIPGTYAAERRAFREHLDKGLKLTDLINNAYFDGEFALPTAGPPFITLPRYNNTALWRFTRDERAAIYRLFGAAPFERQSFAKAYDLENEVELRTYWGVNSDKVLSPLEQRLDFGYMPGMASTNPGGPPAARRTGPLRAARSTDVERTFQYVRRPNSLTGLANDEAQGRPSVFDLRDDTRRLLTTYSGVGDFSPVPVLNDAIDNGRHVFGDRAVNRKVRLTDFPVNVPAGPSGATIEARKFEMIRQTFEAFTWALAPLATDKPLMPPLARADLSAIHAVSTGQQDFHYGGGTGGPAAAIRTANGSADMGASYALLRAASLAINLADAQDEEPRAMATDPTIEVPTVARLFNVPQVDPTRPPASVTPQAGVLELGTRFSHGDVVRSDILCPPQYMGAFNAGVTLIGLDRQPFLRSASTLAVYENTGAQGRVADPVGPPPVPSQPLTVNADDPGHQFGSIIAVELGNPWPRDIDADGLWVALATDQGWVEFLIDTSANTIIPAGDSVTFYASLHRAGAATEWAATELRWETAAISGAAGAQTPRKLGVTPEFRDPTTGQGISPAPTDPVMFHTLANGAGRQGVVMLFRDVNGQRLLLDRMGTDEAMTTAFPGTHQGSVVVPQPAGATPGSFFSGRIASASSIRRPNEPAAAPLDAGFPAYVVESRADNELDRYVSSGTADWYASWELPTATPPAIEDLFGSASTTGYLGAKAHVGETLASPAWLPSFQLFVPNGALKSTSELHMLSAHTHLFVHATSGAISAADIIVAAAPQPSPLAGPYWLTISEQLGNVAHAAYDTVQAPSATNRNPYLGSLDPSRFTLHSASAAGVNGALGGAGGIADLPDAMAIPLAARVFDCFEALPVPSGLAQGRINVNTAPAKVLRTLPFLSPWQQIATTGYDGELTDATLAAQAANPFDRAALVEAYRSAEPTGPGALNPANAFNTTTGRSAANATNLSGLRSVGQRDGTGAIIGPVPAQGFVSTGELALLARWGVDGAGAPAPGGVGPLQVGGPYKDFAEVGHTNGAAATNAGMSNPPQTNAGQVAVDGILDLRPNTRGFLNNKAHDPIDDAEERLAIYRALANTVSTRSDVYAAWFVIRGYDPRAIQSVEVTRGTTAQAVAAKTELLRKLHPTHESRWLAIFDRSNVREAADRPKLLLLTELPVR